MMASAHKSRLAEVLGNHMLQDRHEGVGELAGLLDLDGHIITAQLRTRGDEVETILLPVQLRPKLQALTGKVGGSAGWIGSTW